MKTKFSIYILMICIALISSCDVIEAPYLDSDKPVWNGRKSLLLDFTGHMCGNCPYAHRTIVELQNNFGEAVVPIAVHCGYFSTVASSNLQQPYHYDFTNDVSLELGGNGFTDFGYYGIQNQPIGVINNLVPEALKSHDGWGGELSKYFSSFPEFTIEIEDEYNETDSIITVELDIVGNIESTRNIHLTVYVTESHIIQWQTDYSQTNSNIANYEHNHVLRGSFNGTWGEAINVGNNEIEHGQQYEKLYSLKIGTDWVAENLNIVAFVYDTDTKEVLQVEEIQLAE